MNKKIAPIVVVCILSLYFVGYLIMIVTGMLSDFPSGVIVILGIVAVAVLGAAVALIYTLIIRLKEIDKEDDNDLSKY